MRQGVRGQPNSIFYLAALLMVAYLGIDFAINLLIVDQQSRIIYSDISTPILGFLACTLLLIAAKQSAQFSRRQGIAWGLIAFSVLASSLGDSSWGILELVLKEQPFPSIADFFYLLNYPLLLAGVLLLPEAPARREKQIKKVLDAGIVMVAAILVFWNFLMGPLVAANSDYPVVEQAILIAYPVGDLVLLWALLRIIYKRSDQQEDNDVPAFLLATGLVVTIVADCIFTYQEVMGTYVSGGVLDILWRAGTLLIGLAGISQMTAIRSFRSTVKFPSKLESLVRNARGLTPYFPYLWLIAAYSMLMRSNTYPVYMGFLSLSLAVGGVIGLVLLRQMITLTENDKLNLELQQTMEQLQGQASELEKANQELQNEITERKAVEEQLMYDSLHDAMTGLPNRALFLDRLGQAIEYCKRRVSYTFAVLFVDIDQFKVINDSLGHLTGDQLLISAGKRMKECLRSSDTVARLGGDEFAILLDITGEKDSVIVIAEKLLEALKLPFALEGTELYVTASIGIVISLDGYLHPEEVLRDADIAMYRAKASGKSRFETFDIKMRSHAFSRLQLEQDMRTALENGDFQLYYQPIVSMKSNQLISFEALIRWVHPKRGLLLPGDFLSVAEESGLILPIDKWVLNEACAQLKQWHESYPSLAAV